MARPEAKVIESFYMPNGTVNLKCLDEEDNEFMVRKLRPATLKKVDSLVRNYHRLDIAECRNEGFFATRWGGNKQWF